MNYCAVALRTESGDDYVFLVEYKDIKDVVDYLLDQMNDELAWVYHVGVDSGISPEKDDEIREAIYEKIKIMEEED